MKILKVTPNLSVQELDFPEGTLEEQNEALCSMLGTECLALERTSPHRLYDIPGIASRPDSGKGQYVRMLIDDESATFPDKETNFIGSQLYGFDEHGIVIKGNILFVGEEWGHDGAVLCGLTDCTVKKLESSFREFAEIAFPGYDFSKMAVREEDEEQER
jgi:hypothetical protein